VVGGLGAQKISGIHAVQRMKKGKTETMKKRFIVLFAACYLFFGGFLPAPPVLTAQTAERIEQLLRQKTVSYGEAALLVLEAAGHIDPERQTSADGAFSFAMERGWLPKGAEADGEAFLDGLSLLVARAFGIKGGVLFDLFKNPHYAYRALVYRGIIQGRTDPEMAVSGDLLLYTVNRAMNLSGIGSGE
jgi:hypothetical protein